MTLEKRITKALENLSEVFDLNQIYSLFPKEKKSTLRGRIYRELMGRGLVKRIDKGLYVFLGEDSSGLIVNGDARDLSKIKDDSVHLVVADHPYHIQKGSNRNFNAQYKNSSFFYEQKDFEEKARVLVDGGFLVEFLPEIKESNSSYINSIIEMAKTAGLKLYTMIPWYKAQVENGSLVDCSANVGRKGVLENIYIFSKGKPRSLRLRKQGEKVQLESGAKQIFPAVFMHKPVSNKNKSHQSEKPQSLLIDLIENLTLELETVVDQFAGSFSCFFACLKTKRQVISFEINEKFLPI